MQDREDLGTGVASSKRIVDVVAGSLLALVAVPLVVVLAVVLAVTFRAWPFFVQERLGLQGHPFRIVKLRTLHPGTGAYLLKDELAPDAAPRLAQALRRWHLDELPQLLLVPLGRLSLVGPRPKMPDGYEPVEAAYGKRRVLVPQGCTGLWQIGLHTHLLPSDAPEYDLFYVAHASLRLDLWIPRRCCSPAWAGRWGWPRCPRGPCHLSLPPMERRPPTYRP